MEDVWRRRRHYGVAMVIKQLDVFITGALVTVGFIQTVSHPAEHVQIAALLTVAMTMPMLVRRLWPVALAATISAAVAAYCLGVDPNPPFAGFIALLVLSYTLTRHCDLLKAGLGFTAIIAAVIVTGVAQPTSTLDWLYPLVYLGGAAAVGWFARGRSDQQVIDADRQVRVAVVDERSRIARELHDVVAHGLGVMVLHAEAADELLDRDVNAAQASLARIQKTGRESIGELALLLGLLRTGDSPISHDPQPMLAQLPTLIDELDDENRAISLAQNGDLASLSTGLQLTVFRVIQEALTNIVKHSDSGRVDVTVERTTNEVIAAIVDDGPAKSKSKRPGHGLVGMRERAHLYGGSIEAGPVGDGFAVRLVVPTP